MRGRGTREADGEAKTREENRDGAFDAPVELLDQVCSTTRRNACRALEGKLVALLVATDCVYQRCFNLCCLA